MKMTKLTLKLYLVEQGLTETSGLTQEQEFVQNFRDFERSFCSWMSETERHSYYRAKHAIFKMRYPDDPFLNVPAARPDDMEVTVTGHAIPTSGLKKLVSTMKEMIVKKTKQIKKRVFQKTEPLTDFLVNMAKSVQTPIQYLVKKKTVVDAQEQGLLRDYLPPSWIPERTLVPKEEIDDILEMLEPIIHTDILLSLFNHADECQYILAQLSPGTYNRFKRMLKMIAEEFPNEINVVAEIDQLLTPLVNTPAAVKYCNRANKKYLNVRFEWINSLRKPIEAQEQVFQFFSSLPQMTADVSSAAKGATDFFGKATTTIETVNSSLQDLKSEVNGVTSKAESVFSKIQSALSDSDSKESKTLQIVAKGKKNAPAIILALIAMMKTKEKTQIMAHILSISYLLGLNELVYDKLISLFSSTSPSQEDDEFVDAREEANFGPTMQLLGIGASLLGKFSPSRLLTGSDRGLFAAQKEMEAMSNISELVMGALEEWGIYCPERAKTVKRLREQLKSAIENCAEYETIMTTRPSLFLRDRYYNRFLADAAVMESIKLEVSTKSYSELSATNFFSEVMALSSRYLAIRRVIEKTRNCSGKRPNTVGVALLGAPGIGKSQLQTNMQVLLRNKFRKDLASKKEYEEFCDIALWKTWNQNSRDQYHEGYTGQEIHSNDDMFQTADDSDHLDFINMLSCNVFPTRQAELSNKGLAYRSRLLVGSCNKFPLTSKSIKDIQALQRRFNVVHAIQIAPTPTDYDPTFAHLKFTVWKDGRQYAEDLATGQQQHCVDMTLDELLESIFEQMLFAFKLFEQNLEFEEQAADDSWKKGNLNGKNFETFKQNSHELHSDWIDAIRLAPAQHVTKLRTLKVDLPHGNFVVTDLVANHAEWRQTRTILQHLDKLNKPEIVTNAFGNRFWASDNNEATCIEWNGTSGVILNVNQTAFMNALDDTEFEEERSFYSRFSCKVWAALKTAFSYIVKACVAWDKYIVSPVVDALCSLLCWITGVDISNDPLMADVYWLMKIQIGSVIAQFVFLALLLIWLNVRVMVLRKTQKCEACADKKRDDFHQKLLCSFCRDNCQLGTFFTTHTEQCKRLSNNIEMLSAYTCTPCVNGFCDKNCPHYSFVVEEADTRAIPEYLDIVEKYASEKKYQEECELLEAYLEDSSLSRKTMKKHAMSFEDSSSSRRSKKKTRVCMESSSESRATKRKTQAVFESHNISVDDPGTLVESTEQAGAYPDVASRKKVTAQFEDLAPEQKSRLEVSGDEEMCVDPNAVMLHKAVKECTVTIWAMKNNIVVSKIHGLAFGRNIIIPKHFPTSHEYKHVMVDTRGKAFSPEVRNVMNEVTAKIVVQNDIAYVQASKVLRVPNVELVPISFLSAHKKHDCSIWTFDKSTAAFPMTVYDNLMDNTGIIRQAAKFNAAVQYAPVHDMTYVVAVDLVQDILFRLTDGTKKGYDEMLQVRALQLVGAQTLPGDCGGAIIALDTRFKKKILGFHVLGSTEFSYACILSKDIISSLLEQEARQEGLTLSRIIETTASPYPIEDDLDLIDFESEGKLTPPGAIEPIGITRDNYVEAGPTSIRKHPLNGAFPTTMHPAPVKSSQVKDQSKLMENGYGAKDILFTQYAKYATPETVVPGLQDELDDMVDDLTDHYVRILKHADTSMSNLDEAINGVQDDEESHALDVRTSPGVPWTKEQYVNKKSSFLKNCPLDNGANSFHIDLSTPHGKKLLAALERKRELAQNGIRTASIWKNCLKDETRPIEKCAVGKTRLFTAAPFETVLLFRQLYAKFKTAWTSARADLFHSVGINPVSGEWTDMYNKMKRYATHGNDADFGRFDGCLRSDFMRAAGRVVNETIFSLNPSLTEGERRMYKVVWEEIVTTLQISRNEISITTHGNPSGNPMTTVVNCIVNLMYHWYAFRRITGMKSLASFQREVFFTCFGDDVLFVTNHMKNGYSFAEVAKIMEELGQEYTTASKDAASSGAEKPIEELQFLQRMFVPQSNSFVFAPLRRESIEQQFNWTMMSPREFEAINAQIQEASIEAAAHGAGYYNSFRAAIRNEIDNKDLRRYLNPPVSYNDAHLSLLHRLDGTIVNPRR